MCLVVCCKKGWNELDSAKVVISVFKFKRKFLKDVCEPSFVCMSLLREFLHYIMPCMYVFVYVLMYEYTSICTSTSRYECKYDRHCCTSKYKQSTDGDINK